LKPEARQAAAGARPWCYPWVILFVTTFVAPTAIAQNTRPGRPALQSKVAPDDTALAKLDGGAGLVLSLRVSQLEELGDLILASAPEARGSISLATLGVSALLGWSPLQNSAWSKSGFDVDGRLYLQLESVDGQAKRSDKRGGDLWRSRLVLPARDTRLAKDKLSKIRFRERVLLEDKGARELAALLQLKIQSANKLKGRLAAAGVFLVAKPTALPGIVVISQFGTLFIIDHLRIEGSNKAARSWGKNKAALQAALAPRPNPLSANPQAKLALQSAEIGMWMNPEAVAEALVIRESNAQSSRAGALQPAQCGPLRELAKTGYFSALSLRGQLAAKAVHLELGWHLRKKSELLPLLSTEQAPVLAHDKQALHAILRLNKVGELRKLKRAPMAQDWDALWKQAQRCHVAASAFAMVIDWPRIAGLFLEELSTLHPQANTLIGNLGSLAIQSAGEGDQQELVGEAWIRKPGTAIASSWLQALFGHQRADGVSVQWGRGPMQPYALAFPNGGVVGSDLFGEVAGHPELAKLQAAARGTAGASLFVLRANPSALRSGIIDHPFAAAMRSWQRISADLTI
jgi:hypothetical protein